MDTERAEQLWNAAHQCLLDLQGLIVAIINERAWEPLGYKSFADAWNDRMSDITIAPEVRPYVVYQMFKDGKNAEQVSVMVKGISPAIAAILQRQQDIGVPPELASTRNAKPPREPVNSEWTTLFIHLPRETLKRWRRLSNERGVSLEDFAFTAISSALDQQATA